MKSSPWCPVVLDLRLCLDLTRTLVDAVVVERLLDKTGPLVMLGVLNVCGLLGGELLDREASCPAVLSIEFKWTHHTLQDISSFSNCPHIS